MIPDQFKSTISHQKTWRETRTVYATRRTESAATELNQESNEKRDVGEMVWKVSKRGWRSLTWPSLRKDRQIGVPQERCDNRRKGRKKRSRMGPTLDDHTCLARIVRALAFVGAGPIALTGQVNAIVALTRVLQDATETKYRRCEKRKRGK